MSLKSRPLSTAYSAARKAKNEAEMKKLEGEFEKVRGEQTTAAEAFIKENNKSITAAYILSSMASRYDDPAKRS